VHFTLPALNSAVDASKAMVAITAAVAGGDLTPAEAAELSRVIDGYVKTLETTEIERRLRLSKREQCAMRSNIPRRLRQLEQKVHIHDPPQPVIFVTFVSPGRPSQSRRAECGDQVWERAPGETEENFQSRVRESLQRDERSPTVVIFSPKIKLRRLCSYSKQQ
jgi:hypothetical protein